MPFKSSRSFTIIPVEKDGLKDIIQIETECGLSPWNYEDYRQEVFSGNSIFISAVNEQETLGFILMRLIPPERAEIYNFAVRKRYRHLGIGTALLRRAILDAVRQEGLRSIWLEVRESNKPAIEFYKKNGFSINGCRKGYYTNPFENAILMNLELGGKPETNLEATEINKLD